MSLLCCLSFVNVTTMNPSPAMPLLRIPLPHAMPPAGWRAHRRLPANGWLQSWRIPPVGLAFPKARRASAPGIMNLPDRVLKSFAGLPGKKRKKRWARGTRYGRLSGPRDLSGRARTPPPRLPNQPQWTVLPRTPGLCTGRQLGSRLVRNASSAGRYGPVHGKGFYPVS